MTTFQDCAIYPSLKNKVVLITGGASGIGKELVRAFAEQESNVAFLDLNAVAGEELCLDIGKNVFFEKCDLREVDKLKSSIEKLRSKLGFFDFFSFKISICLFLISFNNKRIFKFSLVEFSIAAGIPLGTKINVESPSLDEIS